MTARKKEMLHGCIYILPSFILLLTFSLIPIVMSLYYSFTDYRVLGELHFEGVKNYINAVNDPFVRASLRNTIIYTLITVPLQTVCALLLAALLSSFFKNRFGGLVRSTLFIPVIASGILVGGLWSFLLAPRGVINNLLAVFGAAPVMWLGAKTTALLSVCMVSVWKNVGYFLVIYYAGMMDIPESYYEAAKVDGANWLQTFFSVTLPSLRAVTFLVVTLGTIWSFQVFDLVYNMTGGGPGDATMTLVLTIYNAAFKEYRMGYASAVAMIMFVFILLISKLQKVMLKEA